MEVVLKLVLLMLFIFIDGIAQVDQDKCKSCQKCMDVCPQHLIEMVPYEANSHVRCNSHDKGAIVNKNCKAGCLGCMLCTKVCPTQAITVDDFFSTYRLYKMYSLWKM